MFAPREKAAIGRVLTGGTPDELQRTIIAAAARQIGITIDPDTVAGRLVERTILRGYATLLDELRLTITDIPSVSPAEEKPVAPSTFIFTEFWDGFKQHKLNNREWKADTSLNAEGTKNIFDKLPGDHRGAVCVHPYSQRLQIETVATAAPLSSWRPQEDVSRKIDRAWANPSDAGSDAGRDSQQTFYEPFRILALPCHPKKDRGRGSESDFGSARPVEKGPQGSEGTQQLDAHAGESTF